MAFGRVIATATVLVKADTDQFRRAVSGLHGSFSKLTGAIGALGLGHLAAEALRFGAEYRIQLDNARAAVDGLTDSEAEATTLLKEMTDFAINTPFDLPGVQDATVRLLAFGEGFGVTSDNVVSYIRTIGNAAASTGKGADAMNNVITVMGKISGQGRVMTRDLNQLTANFPSLHPWEILSDMTGKSVQELRRLSILPGGLSGVVDATEFINELTVAMENLPGASADWEGLAKATGMTVDQLKALDEDALMDVFREYPKMADAMGRKMFTLGGSIEVFKDTMGVALADGLMPFFAGLQQVLGNEDIKKSVTDLAETFGKLAGALMKELAPILPQLIDSFALILEALMPLMPAIADLVVVFALMMVEMAPLIELLAAFAASVMDLIMKMDPHLLGVIAMAFVALWFAISSPISGIILGIALLAAVIWANWDNIKKWTGDLIAKMVELWNSFFDTVIEPIINFVEGVIEWFQNLYDTLVGHSIIPDLINAIVEWFHKLWDWVVEIVSGIVSWIADHWQLLISIMLGPLGVILALVITHWNSIKSFISSAINTILSVIRSVFGAISNFISSVWNGIRNTIVNIVTGIKDKLSEIWTSIRTAVTDKFNAIKTAASEKWQQIKTTITDKVGQAKDRIKGIIDDIAGFFADLPGRILRGLGNIASSIADKLTPDLPGPIGSIVGGLTGWMHADGGVFNRPHVGMVAEAGPEAIIPLSNPMRAMQVMQQAGLDRMASMMGRNSQFSGPLVSMPGAIIQDATDADLVAQRTLVAMTAAMVA